MKHLFGTSNIPSALRPMWRQGLALLFLALFPLGLAGCNSGEAAEPAAAATPTVQIMTLHPQPVVLSSELPGRTTASVVAEVRPQVDGIILKRLFTEGSQVSAGDVLYEINPEIYQAAYDNALASLNKAQAALQSAQRMAGRYTELINQGAISRQEYDDVIVTLAQAGAEVAAAKANVESARINLDNTRITAPISGWIGKSHYTPGALATAKQETALTIIRQLDPINVDVSQSSTDLLNLRQALASGQIQSVNSKVSVSLKLENETVYPETGTLEFAEANVDEGTGTFTLRAEFPNPDHLLLPGMYVRAVIEEGVMDNAFLVPQRAVSHDATGGATAMFLTAENTVEKRTIVLDREYGNSWLVSSGVNDGDRVVIEGFQWVKAGQAVLAEEASLDEQSGAVIPAAQEETVHASTDGPVETM